MADYQRCTCRRRGVHVVEQIQRSERSTCPAKSGNWALGLPALCRMLDAERETLRQRRKRAMAELPGLNT
jgi:hypothetical protein